MTNPMTGASAPQDVNLYVAGDSGPSGFGVATRHLVWQFLESPGINVNFRTHDHGFSRVGAQSGRQFPDTRFREYLLRNDLVNEAALIEQPREAAQRDTNNLLDALNAEIDEELLIRQWAGEPDDADVWLAVGGPGFANHAPDGPYTIVSTDYNVSLVPDEVADRETFGRFLDLLDDPTLDRDREWFDDELGLTNTKQLETWCLRVAPLAEYPDLVLEDSWGASEVIGDDPRLDPLDVDELRDAVADEPEFLARKLLDVIAAMPDRSVWADALPNVDEVWVPSEWTRSAIVDRFPDLADAVHALPYGVPMRYEPGDYDHENCPGGPHGVHTDRNQGPAHQQPCLADDTFTFVVVSRFYQIKGLYRTIKAYMEAFTADEDVRLFVKTTANQQFEFNGQAAVKAVRDELQYPDPPEVGIGSTPVDSQHLMDLLGRADAFVQASRAECFGIAQFQAMYARTPLIYTDYSAQAELLDADCGGCLPLTEYAIEPPEPETDAFMFEGPDTYAHDGEWAVPDVDALAGLMREVFEWSDDDREAAGEAARQYVIENFQWADRIEPRLDRLREVSDRAEVAA